MNVALDRSELFATLRADNDSFTRPQEANDRMHAEMAIKVHG